MTMIILGISLGSRTTGMAIIKDKELLVFRSLTLRNKASKIHTVTLDNYIRQYKVLVVVIKMPPITHMTARLQELLQHCLTLFKYHGCMVEFKGTEMIKRQVPDIKNKMDIIQFASLTYPNLTTTQQKELHNKQKYHVKMFEAVVIAHIERQTRSSLL